MSRALAMLLGLGLCSGCADGTRGGGTEPVAPRAHRPPDAPPDADLLALVPDGAHLLITADLRRLRRFWRARPWSKGASRAGGGLTRRLPGALGKRLLAQADVLVLALFFQGDDQATLLALARGADHGHGALGVQTRRLLTRGKTASRWETYRGVPLLQGDREATAVPSKRTVISGPTPQVKHTLDLLRAVPGYASAREDRVLMALWRKVTGPGTGQPPLVALAARFPAPMRQRMRTVLGLERPPLRGALRFSAGTWLTVRGFLDCPDAAAAGKVIRRLKQAVSRLGRARLAGRLGLRALLTLLQVHPEGGRVYLQWFAPVTRVDPYLARLVPLLGRLTPPPTAPPRKRAPRPRAVGPAVGPRRGM